VKIDGYTHIAPPRFRARILDRHPGDADFANWHAIPAMSDVPLRIALMDEAGLAAQVLCTPSPPLDEKFDEREAQALSRAVNDEMAKVVLAHPGRFIGTATLALTDPVWAAEELRRCVTELGLRGCQLYTSVRGAPLDRPELEPVYDALEELDVPAWLHPERSSCVPDYPGEDGSRYGLFLVFGWPYETTIAMARLVFSGTMQRHPRLKVIAHHAGAMIPRMANRIRTHYQNLPRVDGADGLEQPPIEYFKRFWVDTVTQGSVTAIMAAREVFGPHQMMFASDFPFGTNGGRDFIADEMSAIEELPIADEERRAIWSQNLLSACGIAAQELTPEPSL
jgi:predicted TIM-barrel fold metal-dependent hydrolase